jgi:Tol biopolymer transport system component
MFASLTTNEDIWSLPIDANRGVALSQEPTRLTSALGADRFPSISADGSTVTFQSGRTGSQEQWVLNTVDGRQRPVAAIVGHSVVNAAGTQLAAGWTDSLAVVGLDGIAIDQLPGPGGYPWHFSPDDTMILFNRLEGTQRGIFLWERDSGETTGLLIDQEQSYYQGQFSPDGRWIAWLGAEDGVQAARFRGARPIPESERIQISKRGSYVDKPRWSPDGNLLYYTSDRDGFVCIYAQPLDPETKEPKGDLLAIHHSHGTSNSIQNVSYDNLGISVASDRIVFGMSELTGNIWMMEPVE